MKTTSTLRNQNKQCRLWFTLGLAGLLMLAMLPETHAQVKTWTGGSTTSSNWNDTANWSGGAVPVNNDVLVFSTATKGINTNDIASLSLNGLSYTANTTNWGNDITLIGGITNTAIVSIFDNLILAGNVVVTNSGATLIGGAISGPFNLTKLGAGTLTLANANSYAGTLITNGTLQVGAANGTSTGSLGTGPVTNNGGATLNFSVANTTYTIANDIYGQGTINANAGAGATNFTLTLSGNISACTNFTSANTTQGYANFIITGNNTFPGNVLLQNWGYTLINNSSALGVGPKTVTINNNTSGKPKLVLDGSTGNINLAQNISFVVSANAEGSITNLAGNNTINGNVQITSGGGAIWIVSQGGSLNMAGSIMPTATGRNIALDGTSIGTVSGPIQDNGANLLINVTKQGTSTWTLSGTNTYACNTIINTGRLAVASFGSISNSPIIQLTYPASVFDVSTVNGGFSVAKNQTLLGQGTVIGSVTVAAGAFIAPSANANNAGSPATLVITNGSLGLSGGTLVMDLTNSLASPNNDLLIADGDVNVSSKSTVGFNFLAIPLFGYPYTIAQVSAGHAITGVGNLVANSSYPATFSVSGNTLQVTFANAAPINSLVWQGAFGGNGTWQLGVGGWTNATTGLSDMFVNNDLVRFDDTAVNTNVTLVGTVYPTNLITVVSTKNYLFGGSGVIAGNAGLLKDGTGTLTVANTAANTLTGNTTVSNGVLQIGNASAPNTTTIPGYISNYSAVRYVYTNSVTIPNSFVGPSTATVVFTNALSGPAIVTHSLSGSNAAYNGTLFVAGTNGGNVSGIRISPSDATIGRLGGAGTTIVVTNGSQVFIGSGVTNNQSLVLAGQGINEGGYDGALRLQNAAATWSGPITLAQNNVRITAYNGSVGTITGPITDNGNNYQLEFGIPNTANNGGTLTNAPSSPNSYGSTLISYATVVAGNGNALSRGALVLSTNAVLNLNGYNLSFSNIASLGTAPGATITNSAGTPAFLTNGLDNSNTSFGGLLKDAGGLGTLSLVKVGSGTFNLTATNTYSGNTIVAGGTLKLTVPTGAASTISNSAVIAVSNSAILDVSWVTNGFQLTGGKHQTLTGNGVVTGAVTVAAGGAVVTPVSGASLSFSNNLTFSANSKLTIGFTGNTPVKGIVQGTLAFTSPTLVDFNFAGGTRPADGTAYPIMTSYGTTPTIANLSSSYPAGVVTFGASGSDVTVTFNFASVANPATNLVWQGDGALNAWEFGSLVWTNAPGGTKDEFNNYDSVWFNDSVTKDAAGLGNTNVYVPEAIQPASIIVGSASNFVFYGAGSIAGTNSLLKTNTGTLTLGLANNTYTNVTDIRGGTLKLAAVNALPNGAGKGYVTNNNATLDLNGFSATVNALIGTNGTVDNTAAGAATISVGSNDLTFVLGNLVKNTGAPLGLTKVGTGTVTVTNNNTYIGDTTIAAGTIVVGHSNALGKGNLTVVSNLDLAGFSITNAGLSGTGIITNSSTTTAAILNVGTNNADGYTFSGTIAQGASTKIAVVKQGTGSLTLSGNNTFTNGLTINAGILSVPTITDTASPLGIGPSGVTTNFNVLVMNNATLRYTGSGATTNLRWIQTVATGNNITNEVTSPNAILNWAGRVTVGGAANAQFQFYKTGAGTLVFSGAGDNAYLNLTVNGGTNILAKTANHAMGNGTLTINNGATVQFAGNGYNSQINNAPVTINSGVLDLNGAAEVINALAGTAGTALITNTSTTASLLYVGQNNSGSTYSGAVRDGGASRLINISKQGTGTETFAGPVVIAGGVTITGGTLTFSGAATNTIGSNLSVAASSTVSIAGPNSIAGPVILLPGNPATATVGGRLAITGVGSIVTTPLISLGAMAILDVTGINPSNSFTLASGQTLAGSGIVTGVVTVAAGGSIAPASLTTAGSNTIGTLLITNGSLTLKGSLNLDLSASPIVGAGANDLIAVNGNLDLTSPGTVNFNFVNVMPALNTNYTLVTYSGSLLGSAANLVPAGLPAGITASIVSTAPSGGAIVVSFTASSTTGTNLVWRGDGVLNTWQTGLAGQWLNTPGGIWDIFKTYATVTLDDSATNQTVNVVGINLPGFITNNSAKNYQLVGTGRISGTAGLVKSGSGTLYLNNATNDFAGPVSIQQGTLLLGGNYSLASGVNPVALNSGANLILGANSAVLDSLSGAGVLDALTNFSSSGLTLTLGNANGSGTFSGIISNSQGTLSLVKNGAGSQTLSGSNAFTGSIAVNAGTLTLSGSNNFTGGVTVNAYGTLTIAAMSDVTNQSSIGPSGTVTLNANSLFRYTGTGPAFSTRQFTGNGTPINFDMPNASANFTNWNFSKGPGIFMINKTGPGTLILAGPADNNSCTLNVSNGVVVLAKTPSVTTGVRALGASSAINGGIIQFAGTVGYLEQTVNSIDLTNNGGGLDVNGRIAKFNCLYGTGGTVSNSAAGTIGTLDVGNNGGNFTNYSFLADGAGVLAVTKNGAGTMTLSNAQTYSGPTTVAAGRLTLGASASIANSTNITVASGAVLDVSAVSGGLVLNGTKPQTLAGSGTIIGSVDVNINANLSPGGFGTAGTLTITNGNLTVDSGAVLNLDFANVTTMGSGVNDLVVVTNGTATVSMTSPTVNANFLQGAPALSSAYLVVTSTGPISVSGMPATVGRYAVSWNTVGTGPSTLTVTFNSGGASNLVWQGDGSLNQWKAGLAGQWTNLDGSAGIYSGGDAVIFDDSAPYTTVNIADLAVLPANIFATANTLNFTVAGLGKITGSAGLNKSGTGIFTIANGTNFNDYTGNTVINGGVLQLGNGGAGGGIAGFITNNAMLFFNRGDILTTTNVISGSGSVTYLGGGTNTLTATNTYAGWTTNASTLQAGTVSLPGNIVNNGTLVITQAYASILPGVISGSGTVVVATNSNVLIFTNANPYTNLTVINPGAKLMLSNTVPASGFAINGNILLGNFAGVSDPWLGLSADQQIAPSNTITFMPGGTMTARFRLFGRNQILGGITDTNQNSNGYWSVIENGDNGETSTLGITNYLTVSNVVDCFFAGIVRDNPTAGNSGPLGFIKDGPATVFIATTNTTRGMSQTGPLFVQNGTLVLSNQPNFVSTNVTINGGKLVDTYAANTLRYSTVTLNVDNGLFFSNNTAFSVGALSGSGALALNALDGTTPINLTLGLGNQAATNTGALSGPGSLLKSGTNSQSLGGVNTYTGNTTNTGGVLAFSGNNTTMGGNIYVSAASANLSARLALTGSGAIPSVPLISLGGGLTNILDVSTLSSTFTLGGSGSQTLIGSGVVTGAVNVASGGTITVGAIGVAATNVFTNSPLTFNGGTINFDLTSSATAGNDLIAVNGNVNVAAPTTINFNFISLPAAGTAYTIASCSGGTIQPGSVANLRATAPYIATFAGDGSSTLTVTFTIPLGATGTNLVWQGDGGMNAWQTGISTNQWTNGVGSRVSFSKGEIVQFDDTAPVGNTTVVITNSLVATNGTVAPFAMTNNSTINSFTLTGPGQITGSAGLVKSGTSTLTIGNFTNDFTGAINIKGGTLKLATNNALGYLKNVVTNSGGILDLSGSLATIDVLSGSGTVTNSAVTPAQLTVGNNNGTWNQTATITNGAGALALVKVGTGTLTNAGTGTYTGDTAVNNGKMVIASTTAIPSGSGKGNVWVNAIVGQTVGAILDLNGNNLTVNGLYGSNTYYFGYITNSVASSPKTLTVGAGDGSGTFSGLINSMSGSPISLAKIGNGVITLASSNTLTAAGSVTVSAGTLAIRHPYAVGSAPVTLSGGTLTLDTAGLYEGNITNGVAPLTVDTNTVNPAFAVNLTTPRGLAWDASSFGPSAGVNREWIYSGYINITSNATWTIVESIDDGGFLKIGSSPIGPMAWYRQANGNSVAIVGNPAMIPGKYPIDVRFFNGASGGGPTAGYPGWGFDPLGRNNIAATNFQAFADPGDGSFLYHDVWFTNQVNLTADSFVCASNVNGSMILGSVITGNKALTKTGNSTLTLTNISSYTGNTTNAAGTLALSGAGSIASSPIVTLLPATFLSVNGRSDATFTVANQQVLLATNATILGNVAAGNGASLVAQGTLTIGGSLTMTGTSTNVLTITKSAGPVFSSDLIKADTVTYGGRLKVTASGDALALGDTFQLFNAQAFSGTFATTDLPDLNAGVTGWGWDLSRLTVDGTMSVTGTPPYIITGLTNQNVVPGSTVTFTVAAGGSPTLGYQWYFNTDTLLTGENGTSLVIGGATVATNGVYQVVITNGIGLAVTSAATLTVMEVPGGLTMDPFPTNTVEVGNPLGFLATASGGAPLTYRWFVNSNFTTTVFTGPAFTNPVARCANDGEYYSVTVSNAVGVITSALPVYVVVTDTNAPAFVTDLVQATNTTGVGSNFTMTVNMAASCYAPAFTWYFNTNNVLTNALVLNVTNSTLALTNLQMSDSGKYMVTVTNINGLTNSMEVTLVVTSHVIAPYGLSIAPSPTNTVEVGNPVGFLATVSGTTPDVRWYLNSNFATAVFTGPAFTNPVAQCTDDGSYYSVIASNASSMLTSAVPVYVAITDGRKPAFVTDLVQATNTTGVGSNFTLSVTMVNSCLSLGYNWYFNTTNVFTSGDITVPDNTHASLTLTNLQVSDSGKYMVTVTNANGVTNSMEVTLVVTNHTSGPSGLVIVQAPTNTVDVGTPVGFTATVTGGTAPIDLYWYKLPNLTVPVGMGNSYTSAVVTCLNEGDAYQVVASNLISMATSAVAYVEVRDLNVPAFSPAIVTTNVTLMKGTNFSLTVGLAASCNLATYRWYVNTTNLLAGQTTATLSLTGIQLNDAGTYTLIVSNQNGVSAIGTAAVVTVQYIVESPAITVDGTTFQTTVTAELGRAYWLEARDSLTSGSWTFVLGVTNVTGPQVLQDAAATGGFKFYRIGSAPAP